MAFEETPDDLVTLSTPLGVNPPAPSPTIQPVPVSASVFAAAMRQNNWIVAAAANAHGAYQADPNYHPIDDIDGSRYLLDYGHEFAGSQSHQETLDIIARINQREKDQQTIADGGFAGTVSGFAAGLLDPLNLVGAGEVFTGIKMGRAMLKTALRTGIAGGATVAGQELLLHQSHPEMTADDALLNIGAATIMAGIFGAGVSSFASRAERNAAVQAFNDFTKATRPAEAPLASPESVGAAATDTRELIPQDLGLLGKAHTAAVEGVAKIPYVGPALSKVIDAPAALVRNIGPANRIAYSGFTEAKRAVFDLIDSPGILFKENAEGLPTVSGGGPSIETQARNAILGGRFLMQKRLEELWSDYYWGAQRGKPGQALVTVQNLLGRADPARMTPQQFSEEVSKALRRNDVHVVPQVQEAARTIRSNIFEPWKKAAIDAKIFDEGVNVDKTAESYLMRLWDKQRIIAERPRFGDIVTQYLTDTQAHNATLKNSLTDVMDARKAKESEAAKLQARIVSAQRKQDRLEQRLSERQMDATATERRFDTVDQRNADQQAHVQDIRDFIADLKDSGNTAEIAAQVRELEKEVAAIEEGAKPATEADLTRDTAAMRRSVLTGPMRQAVRVLTGKGNLPKGVMPFWKWVAKQGGLKDTGGELRQMIGSEVTKGGKRALVQADGMAIDTLQQKLAEEFPELRVRGYGKDHDRPPEAFDDEIRQAIIQSYEGQEPHWYLAEKASKQDQEVVGIVDELDRMMQEGLIPEMKTQEQFQDFLLGRDEGMSEADYDKIMADLDSGSASMDRRVAGADVQAMADVRRESIGIIRDSMERAKTGLRSARTQEKVGAGRVKEAGIAARRNMSRAEILDAHSSAVDQKIALLERAHSNAVDEINAMRATMEQHLADWQGKSSAEAISALARRDEAERIRGLKQEADIYQGRGELFRSADDAVDRAVRRIIASDRDKGEAELRSLAGEIIDRILGTPDGRLPYDAPSGGPVTGPPREGPPPRGPLAARSFMIPDAMVEDFLKNNVTEVMHAYLSSIVPDVLLTKRFGSVDMMEAFKRLREEHEAKDRALPVNAAAERKKLQGQYEQAVTDMAAMRDRIRGVYNHSDSSVLRNAGRIVQSLGHFNNLLGLGGSAISQLNDLVSPVMRFGFEKVFRDGYAPFLKGLMAHDSAARQAIDQYRAMGIGAEMALELNPLSEVGDTFHPRSRTARTLKAASDVYMHVNLASPVSASAKVMAAVTAGSEILRNSKALVDGTINRTMLRNMGEASITPDLARRITEQFEKSGTIRDGVMLPNTADWTDNGARLAFEGAVSQEVNIAVVTPGEEKSLFMSNPILRIFTQFKSFTAASTTRILLANLQRRDAAALQGVIAQVAVGMIGYKAYSIATNQPTSDRPSDWLKEGISRSGMLGWIDEGNTILSKFTGGQADIYRSIGADKPLSKYASKSALGSFLGPTWGNAEAASQVLYSLSTGDIKATDVHALRKLMPMQNLFYLRRLLDQVEAGGEALAGIPATTH